MKRFSFKEFFSLTISPSSFLTGKEFFSFRDGRREKWKKDSISYGNSFVMEIESLTPSDGSWNPSPVTRINKRVPTDNEILPPVNRMSRGKDVGLIGG